MSKTSLVSMEDLKMNKYTKLAVALAILITLSVMKISSKEDIIKRERKLVGFAVSVELMEDNYNMVEKYRFFKSIDDTDINDSDELSTKIFETEYNEENKTGNIKISTELFAKTQEETYFLSLYNVYGDQKQNYEYVKVSQNVGFDLLTDEHGGSLFANNEFIDEEGFKISYDFQVFVNGGQEVESMTLTEFNKNHDIVNRVDDLKSLNGYKLTEEYIIVETRFANPDQGETNNYSLITREMIDDQYGYDFEYKVYEDSQFMKSHFLNFSK